MTHELKITLFIEYLMQTQRKYTEHIHNSVRKNTRASTLRA